MTLTSQEIEVMNTYRNNFSKGALTMVQKVYYKYHPTEVKLRICCSSVNRKVAHRKYYNWYDQTAA